MIDLGLRFRTVRVDKYNSKWKDEYIKEEKILKGILSNYDIDIQHIGSTSIIGCSAKPIIDIAIGVPYLEYGQKLIPILQDSGWLYDGKSDFGVQYFLKKCRNNIETHFIHIEDINSRIWQNHIVFRDYLNCHPEKIIDYVNVKKRLEIKYADDRPNYTKMKAPFIECIIKEALKEWNTNAVGENYKI